jgi:hypothetical protein
MNSIVVGSGRLPLALMFSLCSTFVIISVRELPFVAAVLSQTQRHKLYCQHLVLCDILNVELLNVGRNHVRMTWQSSSFVSSWSESRSGLDSQNIRTPKSSRNSDRLTVPGCQHSPSPQITNLASEARRLCQKGWFGDLRDGVSRAGCDLN